MDEQNFTQHLDHRALAKLAKELKSNMVLFCGDHVSSWGENQVFIADPSFTSKLSQQEIQLLTSLFYFFWFPDQCDQDLTNILYVYFEYFPRSCYHLNQSNPIFPDNSFVLLNVDHLLTCVQQALDNKSSFFSTPHIVDMTNRGDDKKVVK